MWTMWTMRSTWTTWSMWSMWTTFSMWSTWTMWTTWPSCSMWLMCPAFSAHRVSLIGDVTEALSLSIPTFTVTDINLLEVIIHGMPPDSNGLFLGHVNQIISSCAIDYMRKTKRFDRRVI